jgi:hypothetical protein
MNKAFFVLTATLACCLPSHARATGLERLFSATATPDSAEQSRAPNTTPRNGASAQANCRRIVVELDEGYGVSRHETRYVCEPNP